MTLEIGHWWNNNDYITVWSVYYYFRRRWAANLINNTINWNQHGGAAAASRALTYILWVLLSLLLSLYKGHAGMIIKCTHVMNTCGHTHLTCSFCCNHLYGSASSFYFYLRWALYSNGVAPLICPVELRWKWTFCHLPSRRFQTRVSSDWFVCAWPSLLCVCCIRNAITYGQQQHWRFWKSKQRSDENLWELQATLIKVMCFPVGERIAYTDMVNIERSD